MSNAERLVRDTFGYAGIEVNGNKPWDLKVNDPSVYDMMIKGSIATGEAYMFGMWDCANLPMFFERLLQSDIYDKIPRNVSTALLWFKSTVFNRQTREQTLALGKLHYDIPVEVWEATLDSRMTGSCAYYRDGNETLDQAQLNKIDLMLQKAMLKDGDRLLDIGVGWAAFSGRAVEKYGAQPVGLTVSAGQRDSIRKRYGNTIDVRVQDYRDFKPEYLFDAATSAEMFEHVGERNHRKYFEVVHRALKPGGVFSFHTIVGHKPSRHIDPWMEKYIYPGGCIPTPGQICTAVHGLFQVKDVHDIGEHYDRTLQAWIRKFRQNRTEIKKISRERFGGMDQEVFCRMWEYHYLACAGGFRSQNISVHQYMLSKGAMPGGVPVYR